LIRVIYQVLSTLILLVLSLVIAAVFALSRPETLPFMAAYFQDTLLKDHNISFGTLEGSLLSGFSIHDLQYHNALTIKTLNISYKLLSLLQPVPKIKSIAADNITITANNFPSGTAGNDAALPSVSVDTVSATRVKVISDTNITLDLHAKHFSLIHKLATDALDIRIKSQFGHAVLHGNIKNEILYADASVTPEKTLLDLADSYVRGFPDKLTMKLQATTDDLKLLTQFDNLVLATDENLSSTQIKLRLHYGFKQNNIMFESNYDLHYGAMTGSIKQKGVFTPAGAYASTAQGIITQQSFALPFKTFKVEASGDTEALIVNAEAGALTLSVNSHDYAHFHVHAGSKGLNLSFYPDLPDLLAKTVLAFDTNASITFSPLAIKGDLIADEKNTRSEGNFEIGQESILFKTTLYPKSASPLFKDYPIEKFTPVHTVFYSWPGNELLNINANTLNLSLFKNRSGLSGWGNVGTTNLQAEGKVDDNGSMKLTLHSSTPSLYTFVSEFTQLQLGTYEFYDAQLESNTTIMLGDTLEIRSRVHLPWYVAQPDSQTYYTGENLFFEAGLKEKQLRIDRYRLDIMHHAVYSEKPSYISIDDNATIHLRPFRIFDTLLLTGAFNPLTHSGRLKLFSERFRYESEEGTITAKVDINAAFDSNETQTIEGEVIIFDGLITAAIQNDYTISDKDIIIIQDIKPPSKFKRSINIVISSPHHITYRHDGIEAEVVPDFTIYQEPFKPMQLLGMVHINSGEVQTGDRHFELLKSDIYFHGDNPINPYLNVHLRYTTIDYIDIDIFAANTLNSPVFVFTSSPPMSQNDILSYLLFGGTAASTFEGSGEDASAVSVSAMLLGTGLKTIFTDATGIRVDTLNILTDKEGGLGYEIGARFSKDIRLVYKNDTISSVILQYSLSKSIRIDVDVHETGQGVNLLYIKDF